MIRIRRSNPARCSAAVATKRELGRKRELAEAMVLALAMLAGAYATRANAQDVLIRDATVHTVGAQGTLQHTDVLVRGGKVSAVGASLAAPAGVTVIEAKGRPVTPGLFAGLTGIGVEEVSLEPSTVDTTHAPGAQTPALAMLMRPEFDVTLAYNPRSAVVPVTRVEGMTWTVLSPSSAPGGSLIGGQGAAVTLDGRYDAVLAPSRTLFVSLGGGAAPLAGGSRAAEWMMLEQAISEAKPTPALRDSDYTLLSAAGRSTLAKYLGGGRVVFAADRASDIRQAVAFAKRVGVKPVISGGTEAWLVADELKRNDVPVLLDPLVNLPGSFDQLGASFENAAKLDQAGVRVAFTQSGDGTHNARKVRQLAGNAVAHGLRWESALAGLTAVPAAIFGVGDQRGQIAAGYAGDLVLWSGDPLEVTTYAEQVWIDGKAIPMRSRQTELRDRYLPEQPSMPRAYLQGR